MKKTANGKKPKVVEKPPLFPQREEIKESRPPAPELLAQLQQVYNEKQNEYFEKEADTLKKYFDLFDRDQDEVISFEEMMEVMVALKYKTDEELLLKELYSLLERESMVSSLKGIDFEGLKVILCNEKKDNDLKTILLNAFKFFDPDNLGYIDSKSFREVLTYFGFRYNEEQVETFMRFADPRNEGKIVYFELAEQLSNLNPPKKKKKKQEGKA